VCAERSPPVSSASAAFREVRSELAARFAFPSRFAASVSLAPSLTETVYALGLQDHLVGGHRLLRLSRRPRGKRPRSGGAIKPKFGTDCGFASDLVSRDQRIETASRLCFARWPGNLLLTPPILTPSKKSSLFEKTFRSTRRSGGRRIGRWRNAAPAADLQQRVAV